MKRKVVSTVFLGLALLAFQVSAQNPPATTQPPALPYSPSLDVSSIDKSVDPCVDFYHYACGGWQKQNPIPPDQTRWSVYDKLYEDNLNFLRGILETAAVLSPSRDTVTREIGDYYAACMDESAVEKRGVAALKAQLDAIAALKSAHDLPVLIGQLQLLYGRVILFGAGSTQDPDNSEQEIADLDQGGLSLPDRDYYTKEDAKSKAIRDRYRQHVQKVLELAGDSPETAAKNADTILRMETDLARVQLTRLQRRDPYNLKHRMKIADLEQLAPNFDWKTYYRAAQYPEFSILNVDTPDFFKEVSARLALEPIENWRTYFRFQVIDTSSSYLSSAFVQENFDFYRKFLRGAREMQPRWKRCVSSTDHHLDDALGQAYVARVFPPELKASTLEMVQRIEAAMGQRIRNLDWMSLETKQQALIKLAAIRNKIGYPDKWRDYSSIAIARDDFAGNAQRTTAFEMRRDINKIGKPVDHGEWDIPAPTVDAYYNSQMNDINFPAGVLQPPLYDAKMDDAPNYGDTGGTVGHELTHGFDDEGSQFDAKGNLKNWWTKEDREKFDARTRCVQDQYSGYVSVDDVHINGALTLGENVADLGGELLAYMAWKDKTKNQPLAAIDGFTPEQRFFLGFAQWDCSNDRPEELRVRAMTDPHSPAQFRINGVLVNMQQFQDAFSCKPGQPMVNPPDKACKVW